MMNKTVFAVYICLVFAVISLVTAGCGAKEETGKPADAGTSGVESAREGLTAPEAAQEGLTGAGAARADVTGAEAASAGGSGTQEAASAGGSGTQEAASAGGSGTQEAASAGGSGTQEAASAGGSGTQEAASEDLTGAETASTGMTAAQETAAQYRGLIVVDPGHQQYANTEQEPIGPGASETKMKVSGGTSGVASGVPEHQLNLEISLQLRDELEKRGYQVIMVRESADVDISNSERAQIANDADADVFVRIHANGIGDSSHTGAMTICQTPGNVFNGDLYEQSRALADCILNSYTEKTGIRYEYVWETDTMSGINWCRVPATIVELGYMTNREEDLRMQDPGMQALMVEGIADGIDTYMADVLPKER